MFRVRRRPGSGQGGGSFDTHPKFRYTPSTVGAGPGSTLPAVLLAFAFENGIGGCLKERACHGESFGVEVQPIVLDKNNGVRS